MDLSKFLTYRKSGTSFPKSFSKTLRRTQRFLEIPKILELNSPKVYKLPEINLKA